MVFTPAEEGYSISVNFEYIEVKDDGAGWVAYLDVFDGVFDKKTKIEEQFIERERENFKQDLKKDPVTDLADEVWLERVSFPIGMSDEGEFFS